MGARQELDADALFIEQHLLGILNLDSSTSIQDSKLSDDAVQLEAAQQASFIGLLWS